MPRRPDDNPRKYRSPAEHNVHFEDVKMPCADGVHIHGWLMLRTPAPNNPLPTLIYFHGNAGNIGLRIPNALQMMQYLNVNILMVEYRGYGNSDSVSPSEAGLKLDGRAALDFVLKHPNLNKDKIFLFGRSLGGAGTLSGRRASKRLLIPQRCTDLSCSNSGFFLGRICAAATKTGCGWCHNREQFHVDFGDGRPSDAYCGTSEGTHFENEMGQRSHCTKATVPGLVSGRCSR